MMETDLIAEIESRIARLNQVVEILKGSAGSIAAAVQPGAKKGPGRPKIVPTSAGKIPAVKEVRRGKPQSEAHKAAIVAGKLKAQQAREKAAKSLAKSAPTLPLNLRTTEERLEHKRRIDREYKARKQAEKKAAQQAA